MKPICPFEYSNLAEEGLRFFHSLANWVELAKTCKPKLIGWEKGKKHLTQLTVIKPKQKETLVVPTTISGNTMYVPTYMSAMDITRQLRNAFCHNGLTYNDKTAEYSIERSGKVKIAGRFTLDALKEFVHVYIQTAK